MRKNNNGNDKLLFKFYLCTLIIICVQIGIFYFQSMEQEYKRIDFQESVYMLLDKQNDNIDNHFEYTESKLRQLLTDTDIILNGKENVDEGAYDEF